MQISSRDYEQINSYTDTVLGNLHEQMKEQGLDNIQLPDTRTNFSRRRLGVTWQGEAELSNGLLKGLETIHRTGDAVITINMDGVAVDVGVGITNSEVTYDIHCTFMKHGPKGSITGSLSRIICDIQLCLVPTSDSVVLEKLVIKDIGHLKAKITGLGSILNFIVSHILQLVGNRVKWKVSSMLEGVIKDLLNDIISKTPLQTATLDVTKLLLLT